MLYAFAGLPGTGKTTLARQLARHLNATYLRIDTIEQALRTASTWQDGPAGYVVAYGLAVDNLRLGRPVVADSVNPIAITRNAWRSVARSAGVAIVEIEVACSDKTEHRRRVETRPADIEGMRLPTWAEVESRQVDPWDTPPIRIDTAGMGERESFERLMKMLASVESQT